MYVRLPGVIGLLDVDAAKTSMEILYFVHSMRAALMSADTLFSILKLSSQYFHLLYIKSIPGPKMV